MNPLRLLLVAGALLMIQALIGGTRLVFALPAYALLALAALTGLAGKRGGFSQPHWFCVASALVLAGWIGLRAFLSPVPYLAWPDLYLVAACFLLYSLFAWFLTKTTERLWIFGFLILLAMAHFAVGVRQFTGGDEYMFLHFLRTPGFRRASGFFIHAISLSGYLEVVGVIALSLACWSRWRLEARLAVGFAALFCFVGVAITGSRGGYLSLAVALVVFFLISLWLLAQLDRRRFGIALVAGLVLLFLSGLAANQLMSRSTFLRGRLMRMTEQFEGKWDIRIYNWQAALDQFRVSPWIGTGSGTHLFYGRLFRRPEIQADPVHAHSDYLELLAEYGIVGCLAMGLFVAVHIGSGLLGAHRILRQDVIALGEARDNNLALQVGLLSGVSAYLAHSAVDFNMHIPANALMFAIIFGVLAQPRARPLQPAPWLPSTLLPRLALPALGLWLLCTGMPKLPGEYWTEEARKALRDQRYEACLAAGEKALQHEKHNPELYFYLGEAHRALANSVRIRTLRRPRFELAAAAYEQGLRIFPQDENLWVRKGQALSGMQLFAEADEAFQTALRLDPNLGVLYAYYAAHLEATGRTEEAATQLQRARQLTSANLSKILEDPMQAQALQSDTPPPP